MCGVTHEAMGDGGVTRPKLTIFEDDIIVSHQFEKRAQEVLKVLPDDWDIIEWGYCFNPLYLWVDLGISKARLECYGAKGYRGVEGHQEFQAEEFIPAPVKLLHSFGLQGYSISAKGARAALNHCLPLRNRSIRFPDAGVVTPDNGIDAVLCELYPTLKAFICIPQLLIHDDEQSSTRETIDSERERLGALDAAD